MSSPPAPIRQLNQQKAGYYGELGAGANVRIKFLQTALAYDELDKVQLIQNLPQSEKWDVRDLFQRDVDENRVRTQILPYLKSEQWVKYFNPLTLVLLPMTEGLQEVDPELVHVEEKEVTEEGYNYSIIDVPDRFQFRVHKEHPEYSRVEWNDRRVKLVAIDGQHRLSALKRWKGETGGANALMDWHIPIVILGIVKDDPSQAAASLLEVVRRTFVYINSKAENINRSRTILLDDESINRLCVQVVIQASHANDVLPFDDRNPSTLPLLFFDWRGATDGGKPSPSPAAMMDTAELEEWMTQFVLGVDGEQKQAVRLELADLVPPLDSRDLKRVTTPEDARRIRQRFREIIYPGFAYLLENFEPYRKYTREMKQLEQECLVNSTDISQHAFSRLRFGFSNAEENILGLVDQKYQEILQDVERLNEGAFPDLIRRDIGMRGVLAAFDLLKEFRNEREDRTIPWLEFSKWFTESLNQVYRDNWFDAYEDQDPLKQRLLTHLAFDPSGSIVNYKIKDVGSAFGTLLALLIVRELPQDDLELVEIWEEMSSNLEVPLRRGYRKFNRAELRPTFEGLAAELQAEANRRAAEDVAFHLEMLSEYLGVDEA